MERECAETWNGDCTPFVVSSIAEHNCRLELALDSGPKAHGGQATPHQSLHIRVNPCVLLIQGVVHHPTCDPLGERPEG